MMLTLRGYPFTKIVITLQVTKMFVSIMEVLNSDLVTYVMLPLFIFVARIIDVSLGTLRIIFTTKGMKRVAPLVGIF